MALSTPGNQQVGFARQDNQTLKTADWAYELESSTILEQSAFRGFFSVGHQPAIDIVVFYKVENNNNPCGFGFVSNERNKVTGGTFRTDKNTATMLKKALLRLAEILRHRHASDQSQSHVGEPGERKLLHYVQFQFPSHLLEHQFSHYFNCFPPCDFSVVKLFDNSPCGFGFIEKPPGDSYLNEYKEMIEDLKRIIYGGLANFAGGFLGGGVGRGRIFNTARNTFSFQPAAGVTQYPALNSASSAHSRGGFQITPSYVVVSAEVRGQSLSGSLSGGHRNSTQWPGSTNVSSQSYTGMQHQHQPQSFLHSQPTAGVIPHAAINGPSGTFAGVTSEVLSGRLAGQQETNQWSGSTYGGGYSYSLMMQQPEPSIHSQSTSGPIFYAAPNTTSSGYFGATDQSLSGSLSRGHPNSTHWPGGTTVSGQSHTVMQHQHQPQYFLHSQPTPGVIPNAAIDRPSSGRFAGQRETNQGSGSTYGGGYSYNVMQQPSQTTATNTISSASLAGGQPTTVEWSRTVGDNRHVQNRDSEEQDSSSEYVPGWDMWK